jgi:hypothetical protein
VTEQLLYWLPVVGTICGVIGGVFLGVWWKGWNCRRINPHCPIWQQERDVAWKDELRRRYPGTRPERRGTTEVLTPGVLDKIREEAAPSERQDTPVTGCENTKRRT